MAAQDRFPNSEDLQSPAYRASAVAPSDTNDLTFVTKRLYIGSAGSLKINTAGGDTVTYANVAVGYLYVRASRVFATGTAATGIVAES